MPSNSSPLLELPYIQPAQAQKHVTHNEALRTLDVLVQMAVTSRAAASPPGSPTAGDRYIVPGGATGGWAGQANAIAVYENSTWVFFAPQTGWQAYVADEAGHVTFDGTTWGAAGIGSEVQNLSLLGVNTTAADPNKLAVAADATLLTHDGDDHRLTINKSATGDTASLLFQTDFTGHAEMGLSGSDGFDIRVSPNGASFTTAIDIDPATAVPAMPQGLAVTGALTGTGVVGTVSETAGTSDGAVVERGSNADGAYVRFADGTQICTRTETFTGLACTNAMGALYDTGSLGSFDFPIGFEHVDHISAALTRADDNTLRNNAVSARLRLTGGTVAQWRQLMLITATSVTTLGTDETEFTMIAVGRWY